MEVENKMKSDLFESTHDFFLELYEEWNRFRTAFLMGIFASVILLAFVVFRFLALVMMRNAARITAS